MEYLVATYWIWFVVALLVGCAVGYWLRWRLGPQGGSSHMLRWGAAAFLIGLVVAVLNWLPRRAGLYLETLLLLSFWYALGGLLGALLRGMTSVKDRTSAVPAGNALPERALAERAREVVKSAQEEAATSAGTVQVTRVVTAAEAVTAERIMAEAKAAEEARIVAAAKAADEARLAGEAKVAEQARIAAAVKTADEARRAVEAKAAEQARIAAVAKAQEEARLAAEAKAAEEARIAAAAKAADEARLAAEAKAAEEARIAAAAKAADEARLAAEAKATEEARIATAARAAEDARLAAAARPVKKPRTAAAAKADVAVEARIAEGAREAAATVANVGGAAATAAVMEVERSHPGRRPPGIASPPDNGADDLKLIKGIGPRNERACNALGVYQFRQIADWTPDEAIWVGHHIAFPGRIEREHWIAQARLLAAGGETEHARAVRSGSLVVDQSADEPLDQAAAEMLANSLPAQAASVEGEDKHAGRRPYGFAGAVGQPDNLKTIRGIGPQNERRLHALGIWHFSQIAAWNEDNVKWVGSYLAFVGRIDREKWIEQARDLAAGKDTEFSRRVTAGKVATSKDDGASG